MWLLTFKGQMKNNWYIVLQIRNAEADHSIFTKAGEDVFMNENGMKSRV